MLLEIVSSALFAPIRMIFYCRFVLLNLAGRAVTWSTDEEAAETGWAEAFRRHGLDTVVAIAWAAGVLALSPGYFWWLTPVAVALVLSVPLSVLASREELGLAARSLGLFLTPEETSPPPEVRSVEADLGRLREQQQRRRAHAADAFVRAVVDPYANALHGWLLRGPRSFAQPLRAERQALVARALRDGPCALDAAERRTVLLDLEALRELHWGVWRLGEDAAAGWGVGRDGPHGGSGS
jgi:membrane glycosyltransferase